MPAEFFRELLGRPLQSVNSRSAGGGPPAIAVIFAALCEALECQPGDLLRWEAEDVADEMASAVVGVPTPGAAGP
jgi:hypothetical protein